MPAGLQHAMSSSRGCFVRQVVRRALRRGDIADDDSFSVFVSPLNGDAAVGSTLDDGRSEAAGEEQRPVLFALRGADGSLSGLSSHKEALLCNLLR